MKLSDPWAWGFIVGVGAILGAFAYLGITVFGVIDPGDGNGDGGSSGRPGAAVSPVSGANDIEETIYTGPAPSRLVLPGMRPAGTGEEPDLVFGAGETELEAGYWVPVVANWIGVYNLSSDELAGLIDGRITDWSQVGGQPGPVAYFEANQGAWIGPSLGVAPVVAQGFETLAELKAALTPGSGAIAFLPIEQVDVSVTAVGVDGVDILRGFGDAQSWPFVEVVTVAAQGDTGEETLEQLQELTLEAPDVTRLVAGGDYLPVRCSLERIQATGDWTSPFKTTLGDFLRDADLTLLSQDGSIQDFSAPLLCIETVNLTSPPQVIEALTFAGVDGVTVATNHIFDCGTEGVCGSRAFERTLQLLDASGIQHAGGGMNLAEAFEPAIFTVDGMRIGLLGFDDIAAGPPSNLAASETSPGTAPMDDSYEDEQPLGYPAFFAPADMLATTRMEGIIREAKEEVDFLVVMFNSGTEDTHDPSERSVKALRAAAAAGADLVIGNQAHHAQAVEVRNETFIAYALGNLVYDQVHTPEHTQGYLVEASIVDGTVVAVRLLPYQIAELYRPEFAEGDLRTKILGDVFTASATLTVTQP